MSDSFLDALAASISSCLCTLVFFPLENLRTLKQVRQEIDPKGGPGDTWLSPEPLLGRVKTLYKGLTANVICMTLTQAIYFWWYRYLSDKLYPH